MYRGTTPTIRFIFKTKLSDLNLQAFYITFNQGTETVIEKAIEDIEIKDNEVIVNLSQEDTLKFKDNTVIDIQARIKADDRVFATNKVKTTINGVLKEGVI